MQAHALVGAVAVLAGAAIQAGLGVTLVDIMLAVTASEAWWAYAGEGVDAVHAGASIEAGAVEKKKDPNKQELVEIYFTAF